MIPRIQSLVKDYFDGREPNIRVKPAEAMALGAAIYVHSPYSDFITFTAVEVLLLGLSGIGR